MKKVLVLVLVLVVSAMSFSSFAGQISIIKKDVPLKVAEVIVKTVCSEVNDLDSSSEVSYDCKVGTVLSQLRKQFVNISNIQAMNSSSSDVMSNSVDDEGKRSVKLRVLYY